VEFDDGSEDGSEEEGPAFAWLPPDDRLWRHPSEVGASAPGRPVLQRRSTWPTNRGRPLGVALFAGTLGALLAIGVGMATGLVGHRTVLDPVPVPTPDTAALAVSSPGDGVGNWAEIADTLAPSLVSVQTTTAGGEVLSSGVLYTAGNGRTYVLTAADAPADADSMKVQFENGETEVAHLVGSDPLTQIALLWVAGVHRSFPTLGSVATVQVADPVLALGARTAGATPVAAGEVTGLDQQLELAGGSSLDGMLAISGLEVPPSADGGALVDAAGAVIGIDTDLTSVNPADQGVAYAVPIDVAARVADQLLDGRPPTHPWIGIDDATDLSTAVATELGIPGGAEVGAVASDSPAARDGLVPGDVVTGFAGHDVPSSGVLVMLLAAARPGEHTTITYLAGHRRTTVPITVAAEPAGGG